MVTHESTPRAWTAWTLPTVTPAIRTSAFGTSSPVSVNSAWTRYPCGANGIVPPNWVHTNMISPMHDSANASAANTAERLGAWVTIQLTPHVRPSSPVPSSGSSSGRPGSPSASRS